MRIQKIISTGCLMGALAALPTAALALTPRKCGAGQPTAASYTWNFQKEASGLLQNVRADAAQAENHAATLQTFALNENISWEAHADELNQLKINANDMGKDLCRLTTIRRVLAPWQQQAVDRIAPQIQLIADNAEDAIHFLNHHQETLWRPDYRQYIGNLHHEASHVSHTVRHSETVARLHNSKNANS